MSAVADSIRLWVREIIVILFLGGALEMILPETGIKRFARVAIGFFVVLAVGRPILGLVGGGAFDTDLAGLSSWRLDASSVSGAAGSDPLERGEELRGASRDRVLAAARLALESQLVTVAERDEDVAEAVAEVALVSDPSSPAYGNIQSVRLIVWMAAGSAGAGSEPGSGSEWSGSGSDSGSPGSAGTGASDSPGATAGEGVVPVTVYVGPVLVDRVGDSSGATPSGSGDSPAAFPGGTSGGSGALAVSDGSSSSTGNGTPAGDLARRLRSELILLLGIPSGGITVEVWPVAG